MRWSLLLNFLLLAVLIFMIYRLGGWRFAWHRFTHDEAGLYAHRRQLFERLPPRPGAVIFLGDSQVQGCEWQELCSGLTAAPVLNRGIIGDHVAGVEARLDEVLRHKPSLVLLEVGINDLLFGNPTAKIVDGYRAILERLRRESPSTIVVMHSVLPVNNHIKRVGVSNASIRVLNEALETLAIELRLSYLDLQAILTDGTGNLSASFTEDGIHLNGAGYERWRAALALEPAMRGE